MTATSSEMDDALDAAEHGDILVVDDNPANLLAMEAALGTVGRRVVRAQSGAEALRMLLEHDFALILLDVQMPSLDGFETARLIRERRRSRHTPIIFVTAYGREEQNVLEAYKLGAVDFLFKPVVAEILQSKATVFVALQRRTAQVTRQSELLRAHERREHERTLEEERRRWDDEALRRQMEEMARADRRKDEFLAVLGHELRNPLSAIVTGCALLRRKLTDAPAIDQSILLARDRIDRQAQHLRRLVDDLLDLARINSGKIELKRSLTTIQQVVEQAVATSLPAIEEGGHQLSVDLPSEPVTLNADPVRLIQVVANLLHNAARYTDVGGKIRVQGALDKGKGTVEVAVSDNGRGISADLLPRVFDIFVQDNANGASNGLGLGLTVVKRLVAMHQGTVSAASDGPGRGSTFTIALPIASSGAGMEMPAQDTGNALAPSATPPLSVVLVEDNEDIRDSMHELLTELGHTVRDASDGEQGVALILEVEPDLAIVDVGLPLLDGYQVAMRVRERLGPDRLRLVAMTGFGQASDRRRAMEAGFDAHLVKPADVNALIEASAVARSSPKAL
ncbi:MAG TPA: response regulator [Polyangia bacterium]